MTPTNFAKVVIELNKHYVLMHQKYGHRLIAVIASGSMNYGLMDEQSDVDSIALICPSLKEIAQNKPPISTTHILPSGEHIEVKDIRLFMKEIKKCNFTFMSFLFSEYKIISCDYRFPFFYGSITQKSELFFNEMIARLDEEKMMACMKGFIYSINKKPLTAKNVYNMKRMEYAMKKYIKGAPFKECIVPVDEDREELMWLKRLPNDADILEEERKAIMSRLPQYELTEKRMSETDKKMLLEKIDYMTMRILKEGME